SPARPRPPLLWLCSNRAPATGWHPARPRWLRTRRLRRREPAPFGLPHSPSPTTARAGSACALRLRGVSLARFSQRHAADLPHAEQPSEARPVGLDFNQRATIALGAEREPGAVLVTRALILTRQAAAQGGNRDAV